MLQRSLQKFFLCARKLSSSAGVLHSSLRKKKKRSLRRLKVITSWERKRAAVLIDGTSAIPRIKTVFTPSLLNAEVRH